MDLRNNPHRATPTSTTLSGPCKSQICSLPRDDEFVLLDTRKAGKGGPNWVIHNANMRSKSTPGAHVDLAIESGPPSPFMRVQCVLAHPAKHGERPGWTLRPRGEGPLARRISPKRVPEVTLRRTTRCWNESRGRGYDRRRHLAGATGASSAAADIAAICE